MMQRRSFLALSGVSMLAFGAPALAQSAPNTARASSPGGLLTVEVSTDNDGRPMYAVTRLGQPVVRPSRMGFLLTDQPQIERGLRMSAGQPVTVDDTWEQPWGERRFIRNHYNEWRTSFTETGGLGRRVDVVFRIYDDGVGFRYEFPEQAALTTVRIGTELTQFNLAENGAVSYTHLRAHET